MQRIKKIETIRTPVRIKCKREINMRQWLKIFFLAPESARKIPCIAQSVSCFTNATFSLQCTCLNSLILTVASWWLVFLIQTKAGTSLESKFYGHRKSFQKLTSHRWGMLPVKEWIIVSVYFTFSYCNQPYLKINIYYEVNPLKCN